VADRCGHVVAVYGRTTARGGSAAQQPAAAAGGRVVRGGLTEEMRLPRLSGSVRLAMSTRICALLLATLIFVPLAAESLVTEGRVPEKSELVARVNGLFRSLKNRDRDAFHILVHPQVIGCLKKSSPAMFETWESSAPWSITSWEVRSIQARPNLKKQAIDACDGEALRGDATALVFAAHSRGPSAKGLAADDVSATFWVHLDGLWYWVAPDGL
jgi:hypothetical protein